MKLKQRGRRARAGHKRKEQRLFKTASGEENEAVSRANQWLNTDIG